MLHTMKSAIKSSALRGRIVCPPSKTYTHRAIFAASLADGTSTIHGALYSRDTQATMDACKQFGAHLDSNVKGVLRIVGRPHPKLEPISIDAQNSGTTIRIASAIASLTSSTTRLTGDASLRTRPVGPLLDALESMGAHCESDNGTPPLSVRGPLVGGRVKIDGQISSQFVTALLMAGPCTPGGIMLSIDGNPVSRPYIDATVSVMQRFGARVTARTLYKEYTVEPHRYTPTSFHVPSDYSILSLLLAASALTGDGLEIVASDGRLPQGDAAFLEILESMGVKVSLTDGIMRTVSSKTLHGGSFELTDAPDLLPPLAIMSLKCNEPINITGIAHARTKESDRIDILAKQLGLLGIHTEQKDDSLLVERVSEAKLHSATLDASGDHRIFMALCIACMCTGGAVDGAESVSVSYPEFIDDMRAVGAQMT